MPILYDNPKEVGADRIANAVARLRPLRRADDRRRLRHRDHDRGHQRQGRVPRRRDLPRHRDPPGRAVRPRRRRCAGSSSSPPKQRDRQDTVESIQSGAIYGFSGQVDGIVDRFQDELGDVHGGRHRRPGRADRPALAHDPAPRAVAHPARPAARLREEPSEPMTRRRRVRPTLAKVEALRAAGVDPYPSASTATARSPSCTTSSTTSSRRARPTSSCASPAGSCCIRAPGQARLRARCATAPATVQLFVSRPASADERHDGVRRPRPRRLGRRRGQVMTTRRASCR